MPDYSYITRALLGLGSPTNFRYDGGFAGSVLSINAALANESISVGQPTHIFLSSVAVPVTELYMPGVVGGAGTVVEGLMYYIKNTRDKGANAGDNYTVNVHVTHPTTGSEIIVTLYEQDAGHIVYSQLDNTWHLVSHLNSWS